MSVFYLLPPRVVVADRLTRFLHPMLPGIDWDSHARFGLAEAIGTAAAGQKDVFVVYREDLSSGEPTGQALANGFGAEPGDEVIEIRLGTARRNGPRHAGASLETPIPPANGLRSSG